MKRRVLSIRVPLATLANCYRLLEQAGVEIKQLPMGSAVVMVLEGAVHHPIAAGTLTQLTEQEAVDYLAALQIKPAGFNVVPSFQVDTLTPRADNVQNLDGALPVEEEEELDEEPVVTPAEFGKLVKPMLDAAGRHLSESRLTGIEQTKAIDRPAPEREEIDLPPWEVTPKSPSSNLLTARYVSNQIQQYYQEQDQVGLMAGRMALVQLDVELLKEDAGDRVVRGIRDKLQAWLDAHPETSVPHSIKFSSDEKNA